MESIQFKNGFTRISNELLEALMKIKISSESMNLFHAILRKTYGYNKKSADISNIELQKFTGLSRNSIHRARKNLIKLNMIRVLIPEYPFYLLIKESLKKVKDSPEQKNVTTAFSETKYMNHLNDKEHSEWILQICKTYKKLDIVLEIELAEAWLLSNLTCP